MDGAVVGFSASYVFNRDSGSARDGGGEMGTTCFWPIGLVLSTVNVRSQFLDTL